MLKKLGYVYIGIATLVLVAFPGPANAWEFSMKGSFINYRISMKISIFSDLSSCSLMYIADAIYLVLKGYNNIDKVRYS